MKDNKEKLLFKFEANGDKEWTSILKDFYGNFHLNVENVKENAKRESGERVLGNDPVSGRKVKYAKTTGEVIN